MSEPSNGLLPALHAAILCSDDDDSRVTAWVDKLKPQFDHVWLSADGLEWSDGTGTRTSQTLPGIDAVFLHESDFDLEDALGEIHWTSVFLFNESGNPSKKGDYLRILRCAGSSIDLTPEDVEEIADYVARPQSRTAPPTCCTSRSPDYLLPALAILCQGYLAAQAWAGQWSSPPESAAAGTPYRRALDAMDWDPFSRKPDLHARLQNVVGGSLPATLLHERAREPKYWVAVREVLGDTGLIARSWRGDAEGLEKLKKLADAITSENPVADLEMVAEAYLALRASPPLLR